MATHAMTHAVLNVFRRHNPKYCSFTSRSEVRCRCAIHVDGTLPDGQKVRKTLGTRDWAKAQRIVREWESDGKKPEPTHRPLIETWKERFLQDAEARSLASETLRKYRFLFRQLESFCKTQNVMFLDELDVHKLSEFRAGWNDGSLSSAKKLERLRSVFAFAVDRRWLTENPASALKMPKAKQVPTLPFSEQEMERIIKAAEKDKRLEAFVYVMRYAGLRISDATLLKVSALKSKRLFLHTAKTGEPVYCPLPHYVVTALENIPHKNPDYFFWSGYSKTQAATSLWRKRLAKLFEEAKVTNAHSHRFRDTFAVSLLEAGVSMENVAALLGHASQKITERHYAPWMKSRQERLEREVYKAFEIGSDFG